MTKAEQMQKVADSVNVLIKMMRPDKHLDIQYVKLTDENIGAFGDWDIVRLCLYTGDEQFIISDVDENSRLYAVNVTGDSVLTAAAELMDLVSKKF